MLIHKAINYLLATIIVVLGLQGCAATAPVSVPAEPVEPMPETRTLPPETDLQPAMISPEVQEIEEPFAESPLEQAPEPEESPAPANISMDYYADIEFIQHRLIVYENKSEKWREITEMTLQQPLAREITALESECLQKLEDILSGYRRIMERLQQSQAYSSIAPASEDPQNIQQLDIAFLESRCNDLLALDFAALSQAISAAEPEISYEKAQEMIAEHVEQGNYQAVLFAYDSLLREFPERRPSLATRWYYGRALQYTGQVEAAARHFKNLLESGDLAIAPLSLQREIGDLLLAGNDAAAAESYYDGMILELQSLSAEKSWAQEQLAFLNAVDPESEDMIEYLKLLREFKTSDYKLHGPRLNELVNAFSQKHAGSPTAVAALRLKTFAANQLKAWFGHRLVAIDRLVAEKKFGEAADMLKDISNYHLPAELQAVLQKTYYDVAKAEIEEQETQRRLMEMELAEQWDSAVNLLDSQQFDAAISAFEALMGTAYEDRARTRIIEAANQAAGEMRKEAASLFIRAGRISDLEQKKSLLLASLNLLTQIPAKYPQTELLEKVEQNIAILREQIERLDPTLLDEKRPETDTEIIADPYGTRARQFQ